MSATLRPRRGKRSTAISKNIVLKRGEIFFEVPDEGIGTGAGKIVMGDGETAYKNLPYFVQSGGGGGGEGTVKSVNNQLPDDEGNVTITTVPYAENLLSNDVIEQYEGYVFRTSGGDADIKTGDALLSFIRGNCIQDPETQVISVATPYSFRSIGLNQFNKNTMFINGYTINASGQLVAATGSFVAYVHAVGGLAAGYIAYSHAGYLTRIGWCPTVPSLDSEIIVDADQDNVISISNNNITSLITNVYEGYICIACSSISDLVVHPRFSGIADTKIENYKEDVITIPTTDINGNALPYTNYGLPSIGDIRDEISFLNKIYTQRIGHFPFSPENLATVQGMGVDYIYDTTHIFYVLETPKTYRLSGGVAGNYTVSDFGTEEFLGTTVPVYAYNTYGSNLIDKLRRDVVTISKQDLSKNQQNQIRTNIGAAKQYPEFEEMSDSHSTSELLDVITEGNSIDTILGANKRLLDRYDNQISKRVTAINNILPDKHGHVTLERVPYADNLVSDVNQTDVSSYFFRTTGGTKDIKSGDAHISYIQGNTVIHDRQDQIFNISASSTHTPAEGEIYVPIVAEANIDIWEKNNIVLEQDFGVEKTYIFIYDGNSWKLENGGITTLVDISSFGIAVTGNIFKDDTITVSYRPYDPGIIYMTGFQELFPSDGSEAILKSTGIGNFYHTDKLTGATINPSTGEIMHTSATEYVCYCLASYSDINGWTAYERTSTIKYIGFSKTKPNFGTIVSFKHSTHYTGTQVRTADYLLEENPDDDEHYGYIVVCCTNYIELSIHPAWSKTHTEPWIYLNEASYVHCPSKTISGNNIWTTTCGSYLPRVKGVADEINFDLRQYVRRINKQSYNGIADLEHQLSLLMNKGVDIYDYDRNTIWYVMTEPEIYKFPDDPESYSYDGNYQVDDFGSEIFTYFAEWSTTTDGRDIKLPGYTVCAIYGQNLKDKLARDVLTKSQQQLSQLEKAQVLSNIGAVSSNDVENQITFALKKFNYFYAQGDATTINNILQYYPIDPYYWNSNRVLVDIYSSMFVKGMPTAIEKSDIIYDGNTYYKLNLTFNSSGNVSTNFITVVFKVLSTKMPHNGNQQNKIVITNPENLSLNY